MKKIFLYTVIFIASLCSLGLWVQASLFTPVVWQPKGLVYFLRPGESKRVLINDLTQIGLIKHPWLFALYSYPQKDAHLKTGEYFFPQGATPASIWKQVTQGTGLVYHPFAIIPGWSFIQLHQALAQAEGLKHQTLAFDDKQIMAHLGHPTLAPEGRFFPDTYYYTRGISDLVILKRAFTLMQGKLQNAWMRRATDLPYKSEYEALIAASLVEKEAYLNNERPIIAGVLVNRLRKDMLLQFDPTVIYGMGTHYNGKIHKEDLQANTPYNTYVHKGLPPTPIAMPGMTSIEAVLHPQQNDYLYFVARGDGIHQFSKTLPEHNTAVKEMIIKQQESYFNESRISAYLGKHLMESFNSQAVFNPILANSKP